MLLKNMRRFFAVFVFLSFVAICLSARFGCPSETDGAMGNVSVSDFQNIEMPKLEDPPPPLPISKEDAKRFADFASKKTGVNPWLTIAIFVQESNLGQNVGACYLSDPKDNSEKAGNGIHNKTGNEIARVMNPERDIEPFLWIMKQLDRDPFETPISCPMAIGWGGGMGHGQFIPSTWIRYCAIAAMYLDKSIVDPWNPEDAFMATAVYLRDLLNQTKWMRKDRQESERDAACMYFSGKSCAKGGRTVAFYGDMVMRQAEKLRAEMYPESVPPKPIIAEKPQKQKSVLHQAKKGKKNGKHVHRKTRRSK